ncbi:MAG: hypothetical protein HC872_02715 [Gammaproteobacteria bacterium]|nr:hypothetical protein [Gammaproteobacteria bacterium]
MVTQIGGGRQPHSFAWRFASSSALDLALFLLVHVAGLLDFLAAALGLDELLGRFAVVAVGRLVAFTFVARGLPMASVSSLTVGVVKKNAAPAVRFLRRPVMLAACTGFSLRFSSSSRSRVRGCGRSVSWAASCSD